MNNVYRRINMREIYLKPTLSTSYSWSHKALSKEELAQPKDLLVGYIA